jgi:tRNA(Ile2) C34 agmatinyltransferase TiaS
MRPESKVVFVNITDENGVVIDRFALTHWRNDSEDANNCCDGDVENYGSHASNALLMERIERAFGPSTEQGPPR